MIEGQNNDQVKDQRRIIVVRWRETQNKVLINHLKI